MIELLVIVSFIVMFSGYSISYYHQFTEGKKLENASKKISTILDLVRVKSTSGDSSMCTDKVPHAAVLHRRHSQAGNLLDGKQY